MRQLPQYCFRMRSRLSVALLVLGFAVAATAQINGVPASVTSYGFGGHAFPNAPRASVTSLGPAGYGTPPLHTYMGPRFTTAPGVPNGQHHHHHYPNYPYYPYYPYYYSYYPVIDPYTYGAPMDAGAPPSDEDQYQGGPTIFDRRGSGNLYPNDYNAQQGQQSPAPAPAAPVASAASPEPPPESPQPPTILVFKDGHKQEVTNYAIVGANLFDLSQGRRQKIAIADLDVEATHQANEDQGIDFRLPSSPSGS